MTKRALVIRTAGDPALAGAIVSGLTPKVDPKTAEKAAKYDMSRKRDMEYFMNKREEARRVHKIKRPGKLTARLMGLWACVYLMIFRATGGDVD